MYRRVILALTAIWVAQAASAEQSALMDIVRGADHQVEIYIADHAPPDFDSVLGVLYRSRLAVTVLVSPEATDAAGILRQANDALDFFSEIDPPTLCILQEAGSDRDILIVDHLSYRTDFKPENAKAFIGVLDGTMEELVYPAALEIAEFMEGLSGTCNL